MAIKIQGSTVIDDSRVATFDTLTLDGTGAIRVPNGTRFWTSPCSTPHRDSEGRSARDAVAFRRGLRC